MLRVFASSLGHALRGIGVTWRGERNFRFQSVAAVLALCGGWAIGLDAFETAAVLVCILLVLGAEMLNTIVEDLLDVVHPDHHASVRKMKDLAAGLVLLQSIGAVLVGLLIVVHRFQR